MESREEREVRVDGEHASLSKGRLTGHQFEPLFEASIAELEAVGLGKTPRELYLSYLRKMPPHLQKEIRADKRLWPTDETPVLRAPRTWEESHKVVLEFEQREAAHKAVANAVYTASSSSADPQAGELADTNKELAKLKAEVKAAAKAAAKANATQTFAAATKGKGKGGDADKKICFHFRDHGNCPKGDSCPYSHDKELRKRALAARREAGHQQTLATTKGGGKSGGKGGGKTGKPKAKAKAKAEVPPTDFLRLSQQKKGAICGVLLHANRSDRFGKLCKVAELPFGSRRATKALVCAARCRRRQTRPELVRARRCALVVVRRGRWPRWQRSLRAGPASTAPPAVQQSAVWFARVAGFLQLPHVFSRERSFLLDPRLFLFCVCGCVCFFFFPFFFFCCFDLCVFLKHKMCLTNVAFNRFFTEIQAFT